VIKSVGEDGEATYRFGQHETRVLNPSNAELIPTFHLLALLGAHHIFHVSGLRVNLSSKISRKWYKHI